MFEQSDYQHPEWQKKWLEVMQAADFKCQCCGQKEEQLNVHHINYDKTKKLWDYPTYKFRCLCKSCHEKQHAVIEQIRVLISLSQSEELESYKLFFLEFYHTPTFVKKRFLEHWFFDLEQYRKWDEAYDLSARYEQKYGRLPPEITT